jgi:hypothetical protein
MQQLGEVPEGNLGAAAKRLLSEVASRAQSIRVEDAKRLKKRLKPRQAAALSKIAKRFWITFLCI